MNKAKDLANLARPDLGLTKWPMESRSRHMVSVELPYLLGIEDCLEMVDMWLEADEDSVTVTLDQLDKPSGNIRTSHYEIDADPLELLKILAEMYYLRPPNQTVHRFSFYVGVGGTDISFSVKPMQVSQPTGNGPIRRFKPFVSRRVE